MDEIVISGIAGKFPESENLHEFCENLFGGVDMVTDDERRWKKGIYGLPTRTGKLKQLDKFDADFFGVHAKQGNSMDPQLRILLELVQEAIMDAGVNPVTMRGSNTGVFIGSSGSESEKEWLKNSHKVQHGYTLTGCNRGMFSNRVSFTFDFHGPSFTVDTACSSSFVALSQAVTSIKQGHCDSAIVGGTHLCLEPEMSLQFNRLNMLSPDGKCKAFDLNANGYVRSEAVVAIFLQKKRVARRVYATLVSVRTSCDGFKEKGITYPSRKRQMALFQDTYTEAGIDPVDVVYVEAHGTGTQAGDKEELNALASFFSTGRKSKNPLLIGSVKTNIGHSEPSSGLCCIAKVLLAIERGIIPGNLHFNAPNPNIPALTNGQLKVVAKNTPFEVNNSIIGLNSFGFGGANVHVILQSPAKNPKKSHEKIKPSENLPYLFPYSGRTKQAVEFFLNQIQNTDALDVKKMSLLHEISKADIPGFDFRGYALIHHGGSNRDNRVEINNDPLVEESKTRPVWFIFSGMGSQWPAMGRDLLNFPVCADSIKKLASILARQNIDLLKILLNTKEEFNNVLHAFVAIASVQIALVDLLRSLEIKPDGIIGHSVGELACAYADDCLTAEQVVLAAFYRGKAVLESVVEGAMAAVGLTWQEAKIKCPPGIYPACHNSKDSVTISGPVKDIKNFVAQLQSQNIFAKEVNSSGCAFHSKYIEPARPKFKKYLDKIIPQGKPRSSHWISSSIPEDQWTSDLCKFSSADYHVNNLISPVLFKEALEKIPETAVVIEIGPHALLQAILKRSLPKCLNVGLLNKNQDNSLFLCKSLGKLYNCGLNPAFANLYPKMEFPVFIDQPWPFPLVYWNHSSSWNVPKFTTTRNDLQNDLDDLPANSNPVKMVMEFSLEKETDQFLKGHQIDGRVLFPATGYMFIIWKAFSRLHNASFTNFPVVIENVQISRATVLSKDKSSVQFSISILPDSGHFELQEKNTLVVSGNVRSTRDGERGLVSLDNLQKKHDFQVFSTFEEFQQQQKQDKNGEHLNFQNFSEEITLSRETIYKELKLRGYEYSGEFRGVCKSKVNGGWSLLECSWNQQSDLSRFPWISFLDSVLQVGIIGKQPRALYLPTFIDKIILDPQKLQQSFGNQLNQLNEKLQTSPGKAIIPVYFDKSLTSLTGAGVQISRWKTAVAPRKIDCSIEISANPYLQLEKFKFTPYFNEKTTTQKTEDSLDVCIQIVLENILDNKLKVLEITDKETSSLMAHANSVILKQPTKFCQGKVLQIGHTKMEGNQENLLDRSGIKVQTYPELSFEVIDQEMKNINLLICSDEKILDICATSTQDGAFILLRLKRMISETENLTELSENKHVNLVALKICDRDYFYLFKKTSLEITNLIMNSETIEINLGSSEDDDDSEKSLNFNYNYKWVGKLQNAMKKAVQDKNREFRIYIISRNASNVPSGALGLVNSLRKEPGGEKLRCFFIQQNSPFQNITDIPADVLKRDLVMNVLDSDSNVWGSYRFFPIKMSFDDDDRLKPVEHAFLNILSRGNLSSLRWIESSLKYHQPQSQVCAVYYAAINFRDVMISSGKLALDALPNNLGFSECPLGLEFSGKDHTGHRIMGVVPVCGLATSILPDPELLWVIPPQWSLKEGATIPVAYSTAYYALCVRGGLKSGESVLIHSGAGAVGLASISIAISMGCSVFTTVGSLEKKEFLQQRFPQLDDSCFCNSRDLGFFDHIMTQTEGRGVDLVLNSLAGEQLQSSIKCLAFQGRFLEIGKVDLFNNSPLGMSILLKNVSVHGILLDGLKQGDPDKLKIQQLLQSGIDSGVVQPLPFTVFSKSVDDVEKAFRFMASGKHRGKILVEIRDEESEPVNLQQQKMIKAIPRCYFDPSKSYIIVGGLGGFGLELCGWLIQRGAKKLVLVSRSGIKNGYQNHLLTNWRNMNKPPHVLCISTKEADVTTKDGALSLLRRSIEAFNGAPIGGIWNLAMVLADGLLENQTAQNFDIVSRPKLNSSMALDTASRQLAPFLDYFIVFSSIVSGRGAPGLSNYAWANSAQERICENRRKNGLPGLAIMWGAIGDVGVLQDEKEVGNEGVVVVGGTCPQRIQSCLQALDILIHESESNPESTVLSSLVLPDKLKDVSTKGSKIHSDNIPTLVESVARILGLRPGEEKNISPKKKLAEMGLDSLISVEVKQLLEVSLEGLTFTSSDVLSLTFEKIEQLEIEKHGIKTPTQITKSNPASSGDLVLNINEIEFCPKKQDNYFNSTSKIETAIDFPVDAASFCKKSKSSNNCVTRFAHHISAIISYLSSAILLLFIGILCAISLIFYQLIKVYLKLFQPSIKLMDGSFEQIFAHNPFGSNETFVFKFSGVPERSKMIKILQHRVFSLKVSQDGDEYASYDSLRFRIKKGIFFNYWEKDKQFDLDNHVVMEICSAGRNLDDEALRLADFYSNHEWDESRPQWRIHLVTSASVPAENNICNPDPEFLFIFSIQHAYGDAYSFDMLVRFCLMDGVQSNQSKSKTPSNTVFRSDIKSENSSSDSRKTGIFSMVTGAFSRFHLIIMETTRARSVKKKSSSSFSFSKNPDARKRRCAILRQSLSQLKSVKFKDSGKPVEVTAVILGCLSKAYERMYNEMPSSGSGPGSRRMSDKSLLVYSPNVISSPKSLNFTNNFSMSYIEVPIHFKEQTNTITEDQNRFKVIQKNVNHSTQLDILEASHFATRVFGLLTNQFKTLAYSILPTPSFLYTSVPVTLPRLTSSSMPVTFMDGHQLKEFYGFSTLLPGNHGALGCIIDSVKDVVTFCLIVNESVMGTSSEFPQAVFRYFQEELTALT